MASKPLRVLCVFSTLNRGGAETMCMNLYRHIDREKVQFDFVKHSPAKGAYEDEIVALGGKIYEAPRYRLYNHFQYCKWWKRHLTQHPEHRIIHCHFFTMASAFFSVAKRAGCSTIVHAHTSKTNNRIKELMLKSVEKDADFCFACSQEAGKWLFPHREFTVLNNAIDTERFMFNPAVRREYREEFQLKNEYVLGTVARLIAVKNPFVLIEVFKIVHQKNQQSKLLWVGDGRLRPEIEQKLREEGLSDSVILTGVRSDVPDLLQAMDCFLLPSVFEGLPVTLIEAQGSGLPCFVSETVTKEADITGLCQYLPLNSPETWADAILNDRTKRENTSQKIIDAGYDIQTTAKWLEDFYLHIV